MRTRAKERLTTIIMFIIKAGFEAHCRNWNSSGKPFFVTNLIFFQFPGVYGWGHPRKTTLGKTCQAT